MNLSEKNEFLNRLDKFAYLAEMEDTELNAIVGGAVSAAPEEIIYISPTYVDELTRRSIELNDLENRTQFC